MTINFKIIQEEKGFYTFCVEFPGCQTQADTIEDLLYNISEVVDLYFDDKIKTTLKIHLIFSE